MRRNGSWMHTRVKATHGGIDLVSALALELSGCLSGVNYMGLMGVRGIKWAYALTTCEYARSTLSFV